jgi:hypothetical protein
MARQLTLKRQTFTDVSRQDIERARGNPETLSELISGPARWRTSLDVYWHVVPYLLTGLPQNMNEPYCWFIEGGEIVGANEAGDIRYLSPAHVMVLAAALENETPDELGELTFDEAEMDRHNIYPGRWVRWSETSDHLGTVRELYSYLREMITQRMQASGLLIHFEDYTIEDDDPEPEAPGTPPTLDSATGGPPGKPLFTGVEDNRYHEADASKHPKVSTEILRDIDAEMKASGYSVTGDFTTSENPDHTIRCYISDDRTVIAIKYISAHAVGGYRFYSKLDDGSLVVSSDAFIREVKKAGYFADFLQNQPPAALHAALLARRAKLEKKRGKAIVFADDLVTAANMWEEQRTRLEGVR